MKILLTLIIIFVSGLKCYEAWIEYNRFRFYKLLLPKFLFEICFPSPTNYILDSLIVWLSLFGLQILINTISRKFMSIRRIFREEGIIY